MVRARGGRCAAAAVLALLMGVTVLTGCGEDGQIGGLYNGGEEGENGGEEEESGGDD
jgi:hypothetical protein